MAKFDAASAKTFGLGALAGVIGLAFLGLGTGWAVTGNAALTMAEDRESEAELALLTPICVAQFNMQDETTRTAKLAALRMESDWKRDDFVVDQGWATMPGAERPTTEIGPGCAVEIMKLADG